jgi:hypothetical protein
MMMMMVRPLRPGAAAGKYSSAHFQNRECYYNFFKHLVKKWWYARIISSKLELLLQQLILLFWHWWNGSNFFRRFEAKRYVLGGFTNKSHVQHMKAELFGRPSPRSESENFGLWKPFGLGISVFVNLRIYTVNKSTFHKKFPKFQFWTFFSRGLMNERIFSLVSVLKSYYSLYKPHAQISTIVKTS